MRCAHPVADKSGQSASEAKADVRMQSFGLVALKLVLLRRVAAES
jgi:hypothetical protein